MSAEIIDGKKVAEMIRASVREDVEQWVAKVTGLHFYRWF